MAKYDQEEADGVVSEPPRRTDELASDTNLSPEDEMHIRTGISHALRLLRRDETRSTAAEILVEHLCPRDIDPVRWMRWLAGEEQPFSSPDLASPAPRGEAPEAALQRRSRVRAGLELESHQAEAEVVKAEGYLREAIAKEEKIHAKLNEHRAKEQALLHYMVSKHLRKNAEAIFAMGPAWTIMRAASAHLSNDVLALQLTATSEDERHVQQKVLQKKRAASAATILTTLDTMSGDAAFEASLHDALRDFCLTFSEQLALRNRRSAGAAKANVAFYASYEDRVKILAGLRTTDPSPPRTREVSETWDGDRIG